MGRSLATRQLINPGPAKSGIPRIGLVSVAGVTTEYAKIEDALDAASSGERVYCMGDAILSNTTGTRWFNKAGVKVFIGGDAVSDQAVPCIYQTVTGESELYVTGNIINEEGDELTRHNNIEIAHATAKVTVHCNRFQFFSDVGIVTAGELITNGYMYSKFVGHMRAAVNSSSNATWIHYGGGELVDKTLDPNTDLDDWLGGITANGSGGTGKAKVVLRGGEFAMNTYVVNSAKGYYQTISLAAGNNAEMIIDCDTFVPAITYPGTAASKRHMAAICWRGGTIKHRGRIYGETLRSILQFDAENDPNAEVYVNISAGSRIKSWTPTEAATVDVLAPVGIVSNQVPGDAPLAADRYINLSRVVVNIESCYVSDGTGMTAGAVQATGGFVIKGRVHCGGPVSFCQFYSGVNNVGSAFDHTLHVDDLTVNVGHMFAGAVFNKDSAGGKLHVNRMVATQNASILNNVTNSGVTITNNAGVL